MNGDDQYRAIATGRIAVDAPMSAALMQQFDGAIANLKVCCLRDRLFSGYGPPFATLGPTGPGVWKFILPPIPVSITAGYRLLYLFANARRIGGSGACVIRCIVHVHQHASNIYLLNGDGFFVLPKMDMTFIDTEYKIKRANGTFLNYQRAQSQDFWAHFFYQTEDYESAYQLMSIDLFDGWEQI